MELDSLRNKKLLVKMNEKDFLKSFKTQIKQIQAQFKAFTTVNKSS